MIALYKDKFLCDLIYIKERLTNVPELDVWNLRDDETRWGCSKMLSETCC